MIHWHKAKFQRFSSVSAWTGTARLFHWWISIVRKAFADSCPVIDSGVDNWFETSYSLRRLKQHCWPNVCYFFNFNVYETSNKCYLCSDFNKHQRKRLWLYSSTSEMNSEPGLSKYSRLVGAERKLTFHHVWRVASSVNLNLFMEINLEQATTISSTTSHNCVKN